MWASQLPQDLRLLRADESAAQNEAIANRVFQYQGDNRPLVSPVATGVLERESPFGDLRLSQKLEQLAGHSVLLSHGDKEAVRRFLAEGCWPGMSATDVRAIQKLLTQALSPAQQTQMGLSIDDIRQITYIESLMGTRHEPLSETAAQMRDDLMVAHGISESEQRFRSSMHLIDVQADGVRVLADELLRSGQLTPQSALQDIAEKSLSLVQTRFQYIKEPTDPDGTEQDRWQSIEETMRKGGGDCEDLAMLQASLLMNLMAQMGYSKKEIRDRVHISGGYMSDAAGNQKGHVLVRLQMNDGDLALDATGNTAPQRFDSLNFDVVFEANDWTFTALQTIDPAFVTALDVTGSTADSIVSRINVVMTELKKQLKTRIDIPLPKTTFNDGAADFFGLGAEDVMQRDKVDIYSTTEFSFFTLHYSTYSPPDQNNRLYLAEIKEDFFLDYINTTRNLTNQLLMLYHIGNSYLDFIANEATDIGMSGYDEQTKGAMQDVMASGDKYKGRIVAALNGYLQKSNDYIQKVASDVFGFVDSNNSAQLQMAQYKIDNWARESLFTALPAAIVDELTNALQMVRIQKKVEVTETVAKMAAQNMSAYVTYAKEMANGVRLWRIGTSKSEVTSLGPLNFGEKVWEDMEGSTGAKGKYLAYLDKIQAQVTQIKNSMSASPTYSATYGLTVSNMNKDALGGELFGAHGDIDQFVQTNMDQMAKLLQHNMKFQNMIGIAFMIRQTIQDAQRELAGSISGKKGTSSSGQVGGAALSALGAELAKQITSLKLIQSGAGSLSSQATDLMVQRINYEKGILTTVAKAVKLALEIAGAIGGAILGVTAGVPAAVGYSFVYAAPLLPLALNPFTAAVGVPLYFAAFASAMAVYGDLWSDYFERNTSNTVSASAELIYSGGQYYWEVKSQEVGTTHFIQEGDTFGRSENGASDSGAALAAANQSNTDLWSDGEQKYYTNRASAKLLLARDSYNMRVDEAIHVGGVANGTASGPRNTQRTEFIADRGDGQVVLNGLLMGSREANAAMLQGSVYALIGIFRAQRDAMENIMSQMFSVQKSGKANAMGEQIGRSVEFEQQLLGIYKQDSQQRMQALNMLLLEDKRQTDYIKEMVVKGVGLGIALVGWGNVPIPLAVPVPAPMAKLVYDGIAALIGLLNTSISLGDALYKYDLGPYSANFASYHERSLNASEDNYRDALKSAVTDPVPSASGLTTAARYARLDQLENRQLAKMVDYGGGVGEWGNNLHDDSILEYSNTVAEGIDLPFRQVNYGNASRVYNDITEIASLRIFYAMIEQALYQQKQNTLNLMVGTSSAAGHLNTMMQILDTYNSSILTGTYDSLMQEAGSRAASSNAYENNVVAKSIEYSVLGATLLMHVPTLFRIAKVAFGGTGYAGSQASVKALARGAAALKMAGAAAKMTFGFMLMYTVKGSNPTIDSTMASYDEDEKGEPTEKKVEDREQKITRSSGGQQRVSAAESTRAQTLATRRERQITLMREIGLALDNATADAAEDVGGVSSSKSFNSITKIIGQFGAVDRKQADFTYQALKQQAEAYNKGIKFVVEGAAFLVSMAMSTLAERLDTSKSNAANANAVKGQAGTAGGNSSNVRSTESKNAQSSEVRSKLYANLDKGLNSVITQALIESILWVMTMGTEKEFYEPFASEESDADAEVEGNSEANSGEGGAVASTDNLENALLGVALMQANVALLIEIQADRIDLASKMAASPARFLQNAIKGALPGAVKNKIQADREKQKEKDLDDLAEMDVDTFTSKYKKFMDPQAAAAEKETDSLAKKFDDTLSEKNADQTDLRTKLKDNFEKDKSELDKKYEEKHGKDFLTSGDSNVQTAYAAELKGAKANALLKSDPFSGKEIVSDAMKDQPEGFGPKGSGVWDVMTFAAKSLWKTMPDDQRQFLALQKSLGVGSAEEMYQKLQDNRLAKATEEARKNVGSTTIAEAQAGMASKDGLVGARKQLSEVAKLEKSQEEKALREVGIVDVGSLSDGDPGEGDPKERKNKKDKADKYVGEDNVLKPEFYALDGTAQAQALKDMGMSDAAAAPLLARIDAVKEGLKEPGDVAQIAALTENGVSAEKAAEIVADIKDLRELKDLLREAAEVGKVPDTEALKDARTIIKGSALQVLRGGEDISKYVGSDKRLNQKFYALDKKKQADTLIKMGLARTPEDAKTVAAGGTQAAQDSKLSEVKAKMADIAAKQSARLDGQDASLNIQAQALQSGLDSGAESLAVFARNSGAVASENNYIADDGSFKTGTAPAGSTVSMVLSRNSSGAMVVQVSKKALEKLDFTKTETQATLANLDGLRGGGDIALVSDIAGISQQDIFGKQQAMSRELSGVQKALANLGAGGSAREMRTLQALGRMEKIAIARDVETLGAELLRREAAASGSEAPKKNQEKKEVITARLRDLQDFRPAQRNALRKEIADLHREKQADGLDRLSPEAKKELIAQNILNADETTLNAQEVARLQADPEAADAVFSNIAGTNGAALKNAVFGQAKEEKLKKLEKKLAAMEVEGLKAMGLDPELTPSARIRLAASDANSDPKRVREILQAQAVAFREQALTEEEARDNLKEESPFSRKAPVSSAALLVLRVGGAIVTAGATELAMGISRLNKSPAVKKAEKEKKNDLERAKAAQAQGIDRAAAAKKFQADVDQLVGVDANARVAGEFVDAYAKSMAAAKESSDAAKKPTQDIFMDTIRGVLALDTSLQKKEEKAAGIDKTATNVLTALVAERDAAVKLRKLVAAGDSGQAADILRYMAAGGSEGQALAAGVLRRLAANGDDVRDLVDHAAAGASPDQLRGLGETVLQAMGQDARFEGLKLTGRNLTESLKRIKKEDAFDRKLGALYGMSGWHTSTDADKPASAKSERGASDFATLMRGSKGFNKALASASEDDMSASLRNLPKERVSEILQQLSEDAKPPSVVAAKSQTSDNVTAGTGVGDPLSGSEVVTRDAQMNNFEVAFKQVIRKGPTMQNAAAVSAALAAVKAGNVGSAIALLQESAARPSHTRSTNEEKQTMLQASGELVATISGVLQAQLKSEQEQLNAELDAPSTEGDKIRLREQSQRFDSRRDGMLAALARDGAESRLQAQQAFVKMAAAINGMNGDDTDREKIHALQASLTTYIVNPDVDKTTKAYTADLVLSLASTVAAGLQTSFTETTVQSDYFKKLNEAVVRPGSEKGAAIDGTVTSLAEISQKLAKDPIGAGAELENVKDRVATVIESAIGQGHVEDVLRVLAQLRQAGLSDLVKDVGALVAVRGDGDLALVALDTRSKSLLGTSVDERSSTQDRYEKGLSDFKIGILDKDSRVADKLVQAQVDTAKKAASLRDIAHKMASGDVALVKAVLADGSLRQDLARLVAEGVALDMPSAYRILSLIGEKPQTEAAQFAEAVGIRLAAVNVDIKTSSRKVDLKQMKETLTAKAKTAEEKAAIAAFSEQIKQGYGVQLYASAQLMGLSREERFKVFDALVKNKTQKAESMFRDLAMHNPQAAGNLMTDVLRYATPTLANTLYAAISKEIPGANGRTLTQIQSLIAAFQTEPATTDLALDLKRGELLTQMDADLATIAEARRDQDLPRGSLSFNSALSTMVTRGEEGTLSIPDGQKFIAMAHVQQEASRMEAHVEAHVAAQVADPLDGAACKTAFANLKDKTKTMTTEDFSTLTNLARELPPTQARELRLLVGFAAMALPQGNFLTEEMRHQQVLDMISVGQGSGFSAQMVADALGSRGAGKLDAVESLLKNNPEVLDFSPTSSSFGHVMTAFSASDVDPAQRRFLLQPGGALDRKVGEQLSDLSLDDVIAFDQAQVSAGVSLSPSHFPKKLEIEAGKLDPPKGAAVKKAMAEVAKGTQTMNVALTGLGTGALAGTSLATIKDNRTLQTLDALGELKSGMAELPKLAADLADLQASPTADPTIVGTQQGKVDSAKSKILTFLSDHGQSAMLKEQQPGLYLSAMATAGVSAVGVPGDADTVNTYMDVVNAYLEPTVTQATITNMAPLILDFIAGDAQSINALVLIASADAGSARPKLPMILANIPGVDTRHLAARLSGLAGTAASTNLGASHVLSRAAMVLREKAAGGSHDVLKDLAQKALRHHHKGQSYERELSTMSGHVQMHKESFVDAMKIAPYNLDQSAAEKAVDTNSSSEGGIPGMLTLLDAQERNLSVGVHSSADVRALKAAKMALAEVYIDTLIKDDTLSISRMDRQLATVLVDSLNEGMTQIMPRLKHRLKSSESTDRLMALIGQANIPLGDGGMGKLRAEVVKASGIFNMEDTASATATLGMLQNDTDLAARTLALYADPKDAADILNKLVAYQDGDAAFAGGLLGRMPEPNLNGPAAQNYWNNLFGSLDFAKDAPSLAALRSGIQSPILKERFNEYLRTRVPSMATAVDHFAESADLPQSLDSPETKAQLRINVADTMGAYFSGALPEKVKSDTIEMLDLAQPNRAAQALHEMMANPQARAMLGRLVAEDPAVRGMVADIVAGSQLPPSTLPGVLKLPGVAAELRSRPMETAVDGLLMAKVMVEPSLVSQLDASDLGPLTNQLLLYGDPTGVLPHLMEHPGAMDMIGSALMGGASDISQDQAMQLVGLARSGKDLGTLLSAVPADKLAAVLGSPRFLEGRSDKMAMLDTAISVMIKNLSAGQVSADALAMNKAGAGFEALSAMLDSRTYGGRNGNLDMSMEGVPKGVKLLIIKHMMVQGHAVEPEHKKSYDSGFGLVSGSPQHASLLASLQAGNPDILLLQDELAKASGNSDALDSLISALDVAASNPAPNPVVDFLTTTPLGRSMMVRLNAMASTDSTALEGLQTKLESANFDRLSSALDSAVTPEAFTHMAQSGVLLSTDQKTALAEKFVVKYPAGSADAATALALLFKS